MLYPLSYSRAPRSVATPAAVLGRRAPPPTASTYCQRQVQIASSELSSPDWARTVMRCATR